MANRYIQGFGTAAGDAATELTRLKNATTSKFGPILYDSVDGILKYYDRVNSVVRQLGGLNPAPVSITGTISITNALHAGRMLALNAAAGGTATLPAATGSGDVYRFVVGTLLTSASWIFSPTGDDTMNGGVFINDTGDTSAATADFFPAVNGTSNTLTLAQSAGAGKIGDWVEFVDVAADKWAVRGVIQGELDPTTPFSAV